MHNTLIEALEWRYAAKKYDPTFQLDPKDKETLERVLQLTPTSYGLQPLHFIWLEDTTLVEKTKSLAWNQQQIVDAAGVLVLCTKTTLEPEFLDAHADLMRDTRGMQEEQIKGFRAHLRASVGSKPAEQIQVWNDKQAYIALGQLLTACALLQLDATPMEGFDPKALDELLELHTKGIHSVLICTIGKRSIDDHYQHLKKVRRPKNSLFSTR
jgi:nitroreductase / dihydropteridine reductase